LSEKDFIIYTNIYNNTARVRNFL